MDEFQALDILMVEDTATDAEMTMRVLRKSGLANKLVWVKDGSEALDFLFHAGPYSATSNGRPKLILLDIKLPKVDGIEVLRRIRQDKQIGLTPVVMLTSSAEERDLMTSYQVGANSYIVKPVDTDEFDRVVSEVGLYWMLMNRPPNQSICM
jgi:CheY-like chemotaxis protein